MIIKHQKRSRPNQYSFTNLLKMWNAFACHPYAGAMLIFSINPSNFSIKRKSAFSANFVNKYSFNRDRFWRFITINNQSQSIVTFIVNVVWKHFPIDRLMYSIYNIVSLKLRSAMIRILRSIARLYTFIPFNHIKNWNWCIETKLKLRNYGSHFSLRSYYYLLFKSFTDTTMSLFLSTYDQCWYKFAYRSN